MRREGETAHRQFLDRPAKRADLWTHRTGDRSEDVEEIIPVIERLTGTRSAPPQQRVERRKEKDKEEEEEE